MICPVLARLFIWSLNNETKITQIETKILPTSGVSVGSLIQKLFLWTPTRRFYFYKSCFQSNNNVYPETILENYVCSIQIYTSRWLTDWFNFNLEFYLVCNSFGYWLSTKTIWRKYNPTSLVTWLRTAFS